MKGGIILLKSIEHFIVQSAEEGFHNAVVVTVALSGHGLNDSVFLKFTTVECVLVLPALIRVHDQTLYRGKADSARFPEPAFSGLPRIAQDEAHPFPRLAP